MHKGLLVRTSLLFLATTCFTLALQPNELPRNEWNQVLKEPRNYKIGRVKRATGKPGFFRTLFSVIYEQWSDTKNTINKVNTMVNDNFLPENVIREEATTPANTNVTTKPTQYMIKRSELNRIINRNVKGLVRLFNIELQDALKQSDKNYAEYRKNASLEVSKFL